jgi:CBS domain-containing protein
MGEHDVGEVRGDGLRMFTKALLEDIAALEQLLQSGRIESGTRRIGAEQEMFLVRPDMNPAPIATDILERIDDPRMTTELARFNLEANLSPHDLGGDCLRKLEDEIDEVVGIARRAAQELGSDVLLTGILPTLGQEHLGLDNMTPARRYHDLNRMMKELRGGDFHVFISGVDEFEITHDNVMFESCNTSFQVHFQVGAEEFARLYNLAQVVTAPVLAAAANSPVLLRRRLWAETRVALFASSVDTRSDNRMRRPQHARVQFGEKWIDDSVLEIFKRDVGRFRIMLGRSLDEKPLEVVAAGGTPELRALRLHNGTVYRWNRACYGITDGKPHLRIENRVLPAGPTPLDEVANAAFFFGLMAGVGDQYAQIDRVMQFDEAKSNFFAAARYGLRAQFSWLEDKTVTASDLILHELLPAAREGLEARGIDSSDIDRYLGVIEERVRAQMTGSRWILDSLSKMDRSASADARFRSLTSKMLEHSYSGLPVHRWPLAELDDRKPLRASIETVGQIMSSDLFTVRPGDIVDLAASLMDWEHIRHVPVEDEQGHLLGLISHRQLVRLLTRADDKELRVEDVMTPNPVAVRPDTPTLEALRLMRSEKVGCLPVVRDRRLVGILTERDIIQVAARLLDEFLQSDEPE